MASFSHTVGHHTWRFDSLREVMATLCGPPIPDDVPFTVVEGWRIREIDAALAAGGFIEPGAYQALARARRKPDLDVAAAARAGQQRLYVLEQRGRHVHALHGGLQLAHALGIQRGLHAREQVAAIGLRQQRALVRGVRISQRDAHEETVELRLGQPEGA